MRFDRFRLLDRVQLLKQVPQLRLRCMLWLVSSPATEFGGIPAEVGTGLIINGHEVMANGKGKCRQ